MKQVLIKKGQAVVEEVPAPAVSDNRVLVQVIYSCISAGTEMSGVRESGKSLLKKAIEKPEKIGKALSIAKNRGLNTVVHKVKNMNIGKPTGYSAAGIVIGVGKNITDIKTGEYVACAGAGIANHAEMIDVPRNLIVKVPKGVSLESASAVALGGIALQGIRRSEVKLGEYVAVIGLGILGQLTVQMLKTAGCRVIGIDIEERRLEIAKENGCDYIVNSIQLDTVKEVEKITEGYGTDAVIITAASSTSGLLSQAFKICRKKGKVVLVGVVENQFDRNDMYPKELDFLISTSYGPGRYDTDYEEDGHDYPYAYVRWTENRNMEEYLRLIQEKKIKISPLIDRIYKVDEAYKAYEELNSVEGNKPLIVLLKYSETIKQKISRKLMVNSIKELSRERYNVAIVGAGGFAKEMHLPNLKKLENLYTIYGIMSKTGSNAKEIAKQYEARYATTEYNDILNDPEVDIIMICTRHHLHASMAIEAMKKKKAVFLEKPMALDEKELNQLSDAAQEAQTPFMVGFNRRFSKYAVEAKKHIINRKNPMIINYQMNAGYIPLNHWVNTKQGGGRIIGEGCHIFDLFSYFTDSSIESMSVNSITPKTKNIAARDNVVITLKYEDGSLCTLTYTAIGNSNYPKEFFQIFCDGNIITIDDYKSISGYGVKVSNIKSKTPEKGQLEELIEFYHSIKRGEKYLIPFSQLEEVTRISFLAERELRNGFK